MNTAAASAEGTFPTELLWVRMEAGQPRIRWPRVVSLLFFSGLLQVLSAALVSQYAQTPVRPAMLVLLFSGVLAYLVVVIEQQRQALLLKRWKLQLSLRAFLVLLLVACIFFCALGNELRNVARDDAARQKARATLMDALQGGTVTINSPNGTGVSCNATRPDFNDDDLARIIELASQQTGACELSMLVIEKTSVTSAGVENLADCRKLTFLALPPVKLTDLGIEAIAGNAKLRYLLLDEKQLTSAQLLRLQRSLPNVRLNGKTWRER